MIEQRWILCLAAVLSLSAGAAAAVKVSPVVIDAYQVEQGQMFTVTLYNSKAHPVDVNLEWGWFDLQEDGTVVLDNAAGQEQDWLHLPVSNCRLEPESAAQIQVALARADFTAITPVLYINLQDPTEPVSLRVAVLFALSLERPAQPAQLEVLGCDAANLRIRAANPNTCHIFFDGVLRLYRAGALVKEVSIPPRLILAESRREFSLPLIPGADQAVINSKTAASLVVELATGSDL
ncbi:MAG TPA: hypothetical protein PLK83_04395 [Limnochordia bacterium]|nr:hypothetical protein [Limnochordia bacterium]